MKISKKKNSTEKNIVKSYNKSKNELSNQIKQFSQSMLDSEKYRRMSHGSYEIFKLMPHSRGEYWRQNHKKSLNKSNHKKHK